MAASCAPSVERLIARKAVIYVSEKMNLKTCKKNGDGRKQM
jgi:hypothetical protein